MKIVANALQNNPVGKFYILILFFFSSIYFLFLIKQLKTPHLPKREIDDYGIEYLASVFKQSQVIIYHFFIESIYIHKCP